MQITSQFGLNILLQIAQFAVWTALSEQNIGAVITALQSNRR